MGILASDKNHPCEDIVKGKFILDPEEKQFHSTSILTSDASACWTPPPEGWYKLNTDGSFGLNGDAGAGIIVRDHKGYIILSSCRQLISCRDALDAEIKALLQGISLALSWCNQPLMIEVDCLEMVKILNNKETDRSVYSTMIEEIKTVMKVRQTCITHIKRCQNTSSHFMANYARTNAHTAVWLWSRVLTEHMLPRL